MRFFWALALLLSTACAAAREPAATAAKSAPPAVRGEIERVVLITVDGLRPVDALRFPTLQKLAREGAFAPPPGGALTVTPSVTYPSHTSIVTGSYPARHGITTNHAPDPTPDGQNLGGWRWYAEDIRVPTLWGQAFDAGLRTALVTWPVTVNARATARMPEYWRAGLPEDIKLLRALATPGLFELVEREHPGFAADYTPPKVKDSATIDAALTVLTHVAPALMLMHIWQTDDAQHKYGPDSPEANAALANADTQIARLLAALRKEPEWPRTVLAVLSDHGFAPLHTRVLLNVHLATAGLAERVWFSANGGLAYLYLRALDDREAADKLRVLFQGLARDPAQGIAQVLEPGDIAAAHGDPQAVLALEAIPGFAFARRNEPNALSPTDDRGTHGQLPERPEMRATLILYGPRIPAMSLVHARLIDVAPTLAGWLGLSLPDSDGHALPNALKP
jgi:predicted AlkP superfamily pyrophosphatase or phosphodiesterase